MHSNHTALQTAQVRVSRFDGEQVTEFHLFAEPTIGETLKDQLNSLIGGVDSFFGQNRLTADDIMFQRLFVSDYSNQSDIIDRDYPFSGHGSLSIVQQPLLNGKKVGLWMYAVKASASPIPRKVSANECSWTHNGYTHRFHHQLTDGIRTEDPLTQTSNVFAKYIGLLKEHGLNLYEHCIRTWLFVRDVDNNYADVVTARNQIFDTQGLTKETHFIASTGIEGRHADPKVKLIMDAYAVQGLQAGQVSFLEATSHLNPTHEYGVAFERATAVDYGDRRHIFISGTASIDHKGDIVHVGNIEGQIRRTFENIGALLAKAEARPDDLVAMVVYLRDTADYQTVKNYLRSNYAHVPYAIVWAPVCRPGWLIEIEGIAIKKINAPQYISF
ncbi:MAG: Rid family hydrolase [Breznakibacter sp.]